MENRETKGGRVKDMWKGVKVVWGEGDGAWEVSAGRILRAMKMRAGWAKRQVRRQKR